MNLLPTSTDPILELQNVSVAFNHRSVFDHLSLSIHAREVVAIVGPSGSGKSTLLSVMAGLSRPQAGVVKVEGKSSQRPHPSVGIMFQDPCLLPWLTVRENVGFGLTFHSQPRLHPSERAIRVINALGDVGLTHAADFFPSQLSGGMAQRTALARCLVRQPSLLLLDEPFSALDEVTRQDMQQLLRKTAAQHQAAVVLVTHDVPEALALADRVVLLKPDVHQALTEWRTPAATEHVRKVHREISSALAASIRIAHPLSQGA